MAKNLYTIFLGGEYEIGADDYYRRLIERSTSIAVDGGVEIFERLGLAPTILLGDFDTRPEAPAKFADKSEIIRAEIEKGQTDGELAFELAAERGAEEIILAGYAGGSELDHQLGNLLLLSLALKLGNARKTPLIASAVRPGERIWYLTDDTVELVGSPGDIISVVPLDSQITLSVNGLKYDANQLIAYRGSTRTLRNELTGRGARVTVYGSALVIYRKPE